MPIVLDTKPLSGYDDLLPGRYHFPRQYLNVATAGIGDWIVFRKPRRGAGDTGYFAVAQLRSIEPDHRDAGSFYAILDGYLAFDRVVPPNRPDDQPYEAVLRGVPTKSRGAAIQGKSVRPIGDADFGAIVRAGLDEIFDPANAIRLELDPLHSDPTTTALLNAPAEDQERQIKQILLNRKIRDAAFRKTVCDAYEDTCAITGLRIVNGGGKTEVQAAHVWSVADGGPDIVQNGIALSGTVHWLFDRKLISISDDYRLLISHNKVPQDLQRLFENQLNRIRLPKDEQNWPNTAYLRRHRESAMLD